MIFFCHTVGFFGGIIGITSQFFNIGVDVFFLLSALLFSCRTDALQNVLKWYKKRYYRIGVPYYILLICLFILYTVSRINTASSDWIGYIFFCQGITENYLPGLAHLWYLTAIMLCYLITPVLYRIRTNRKKNVVVMILLVMYIYFGINYQNIFPTIMFSMAEYVIGFLTIKKVLEIFSSKPRKSLGLSFGLFGVFCVCKIVFNSYFDGTMLYMNFLVPVIDFLIGYTIFIIVFLIGYLAYRKISDLQGIKNVTNHLDSITFEFYLIHYVLITGPFTVNMAFPPILKVLLIFVVSYLLANLLHKMGDRVNRYLPY